MADQPADPAADGDTVTLTVTEPYYIEAFTYTDESGAKPVETTITREGTDVPAASADAIVSSAKDHNVKVTKTTKKAGA